MRPIDAGLEAATLTLDDRGMIRDCNSAAERLFKYRRGDLARREVSLLLPQLAAMAILSNGELNPHLRFLCRIGRVFHAVAQDGERFASDIYFNVLDGADPCRVTLIVRPVATDAANRRWLGAVDAPMR